MDEQSGSLFHPKFQRCGLGDARFERMLKLAERWSEDEGFLKRLRTVCLYGRYEDAFAGKPFDVHRGLALLSRPDIAEALGEGAGTDEEKAFVATVMAEAPECRDSDGCVAEDIYDWDLYFDDAECLSDGLDRRWGLVRFDKAQMGLWEPFSASLRNGERPKLWIGLFAPVMRGAFEGAEEEFFSFANKEEAYEFGDQMARGVLFKRWFETISLIWKIGEGVGLKNVFTDEDIRRIHVSSTLLDYCAGGYTCGYNVFKCLFGGPNEEAQSWLGLKGDR